MNQQIPEEILKVQEAMRRAVNLAIRDNYRHGVECAWSEEGIVVSGKCIEWKDDLYIVYVSPLDEYRLYQITEQELLQIKPGRDPKGI